MQNKHNLTIPFTPGDFQNALLGWYDASRRALPWRAKPGTEPDPYRVWLSEIMLQQTTVKAVIPYFEAFLARWPTALALGGASRDEILAAWAGLGYYSRARNLHACAQRVARNGFPADETGLRQLPGVGAYTAAAIAAIAFGKPAAAVDGNVERVLARLFGLSTPLPRVKPSIRALAGRLVSEKRPGDYTQAMMDLGATICTPRSPLCPRCPVSPFCAAFRRGEPERFPIKAPKAPRPIRRGDAFVIVREIEGRPYILLRRRPENGLLGGMMEVPCTEWLQDSGQEKPVLQTVMSIATPPHPAPDGRHPLPQGERVRPRSGHGLLPSPLAGEGPGVRGGPNIVKPGLGAASSKWTQAEPVQHTFTHFHLEMRVFAARCAQVEVEVRAFGGEWTALLSLPRHALPSVMKKAVVSGLGALGLATPN
jgi:A/G-specific adenine glycosylase